MVWRVADDYVKLHVRKEFIWVVCVNEHIGVLLCFVASVIDDLAGVAILALAVFPGMADVLVDDVAAWGVELGNAEWAVGILAAIDGAAGEQGREFRDGYAEHLLVQDVVYALLTVWYFILKSSVEPLHNLAQEDAAFSEGVEEGGLFATEQLLRQEVEHLVCQLRGREHFVVAQVGYAIQHIRIVIHCIAIIKPRIKRIKRIIYSYYIQIYQIKGFRLRLSEAKNVPIR